jgi:acetyltransferase-like isoleucine patch superfamily enzyme
MDQFILKIKRGESPFFRGLRSLAKAVMRSNLPVPGLFRPVLRLLYQFHFFVLHLGRLAVSYLYREPLFRSRCASVGKRLHVALMPDISGHAEIHIGDDVNLFGILAVSSGRVLDNPRLLIGNRVDIGHYVVISVNREVIIEDGVHIASNCRIVDNDGHPSDPVLRDQGHAPSAEDCKAVKICKNAWLGHGCYVMKGVTIGEGAIIGAASVVLSNIPPFTVAIGNPARPVTRAVGKPAQAEGATTKTAQDEPK